ncbi:MAG TPA: DNA polymerase III subunit gamma/tau [Acidobacteriaceae bacterium]
MAYQVLARKYRPQRFSDVVGQEHVTRTLLNALSQGRIAHGYIFSGHRGIGKTTIARILAMALNCRTPLGEAERPSPEPCGICVSCQEIRSSNSVDMMEIDAATNRGIDEIRELRDAARYSPARDRYKIYLLDEAHQITDAAFNALLKTLEEPPDHVVFMMATTQPEDIPQTIRSRCQHFSFHAVRYDDILEQLRQIAELEGIHAEDAALSLLAEAGDGSMRDALSIMDQAIASAPAMDGKLKLETEQIRELMGTIPNAVFERLLESVHENQSAAVMEEVNRLLNAGNSPAQLARQLVRYLRNALMAKLGGETTELLQISTDERARASRSAELFSEEDLTRFLQVMLRTFDDLNYRQEQRFHLELGLLKLVHLERLIPLEQILSSLPGASGPSRPGPNMQRPASGASPRPASQTPRPPPQASRFETAASTAAPQAMETILGPADAPRPHEVTAQASPPVQAMVSALELEPDSEPDVSGELETGQASGPVASTITDTAGLDQVREAVVAALDGNGHNTAAALLSAGIWKNESDGAIQVEVGVKKTMLSLTMNAEAWRITREALNSIGASPKMIVMPGEGGSGAPATAPQPASGSIQAVALENPLVRQAQELFRAEVRSVLDLRESSQENSRNKR